jgi:hypothetical protein
LTGAFDPPLDKDIDDVLAQLVKAELLLPECPERNYHLVSPDGTCGDLAGAMRDRCETEGDALAKAIIQGFPIPEEEELEQTMTEEPMDAPKNSKEPVTPQLTVSPTVSPQPTPKPKRKRTKTPMSVGRTRKKSVQVKSEAAAEGEEEEEEKHVEEETPAPKRKRAPRKPPTPKKCEAASQPRRESPVVAISKQLQSRPNIVAKDATILPSTVRAVRDSMVTQRVDTAIKNRNDAFWDYLEQILSHRDEAIRRDLYAVHAAIALMRKDLQLEQQGFSSEGTREMPVTPDGLAEDFAKEAQTRLDQCAKELERLKRHLPSKKPPTKMDAASQKPSDAEEEEEEEEESDKSEEGEPSSEEMEEERRDEPTESVDPRLDIHGGSPRGERLSAMQIARRATMRMQTLFAAAAAVNAHAQATSPTSDDSPDSVTMKTPRRLHS